VINMKMDHREVLCEDGRRKGLTQDHVQWRILVLPKFYVRVMLTDNLFSYLVSYILCHSHCNAL
jgi:hypothetical protein